MTTIRVGTLAVLLVLTLATGPLQAQQSTQQPQPFPIAKVDVVLERYQSEKKVASMPFSLWVTHGVMNNPASPSSGSVRIGVDVPIGSIAETEGSNSPNGRQSRSATTTTPQYRNVGTSIDCYLSPGRDGKYDLQVRLSDSSIFEPTANPRACSRSTSASRSAPSAR